MTAGPQHCHFDWKIVLNRNAFFKLQLLLFGDNKDGKTR